MREILGGFRRSHRFAGPLEPRRRERHKNAFTFPGTTPPTAPAPITPPVMPDPMSPAAIEAKRQALAKTNQAGRSSTTLTTAAATAGSTLAGSAMGSQKLGAR